mgnify:CR=1 FL=1
MTKKFKFDQLTFIQSYLVFLISLYVKLDLLQLWNLLVIYKHLYILGLLDNPQLLWQEDHRTQFYFYLSCL